MLWLLRIAGLRIGEAYGLLVSNFVEQGGEGYLLIEAQGGRIYRVRDDNEATHRTTRKRNLKTSAGYRLIALPASLAALIRLVIRAFHTDPLTGEVDFGARLVPVVQSRGGGQAGFRSALKRAASAVSGASVAPEDYVIPHDMRKAYAADLAWDQKLDDLLRRRAMGQRAGSDVFSLVYTLDDRLCEAMLPAAARVEADVVSAIGSLIVPTTRRPFYAAGRSRELAAYVDAVLAEADWQIDALGEGWLTADQAADLLEMSVTATRRLFSVRIPALKVAGGWRVRLDDVLAYRARLDEFTFLVDLIDKTGRTYHQLYALVGSLGLEPRKDDYSRELLLTGGQAQAIVAECQRIDDLHRRAVPVAQACRLLRMPHSSVHLMAADGRLAYDAETDSSGRKFITRTSLATLTAERRRGLEVVSAEALKRAAGIDDPGLKALCNQGLLVRARRGGFTAQSVRAWAVGYRPHLLDSPLLSGALA